MQDSNSLDSIHLAFRLHHVIVLVTLLNDLLREGNDRNVTMLILLDLTVTLNIFDRGNLLDRLLSLGNGELVLRWL